MSRAHAVPPDGFVIRDATADDATLIAEIVNEVMVAESGLPWTTVEETRDDLRSPGRDPTVPNVLLLERDGAPVGYLNISLDAGTASPVELFAYVRPHVWGRGLSAWLLRLGEGRVRRRVQPEGAGERRPVLQVARFTGNEVAGRLFEALGYAYVRTFWMMRIGLENAPPAPRVPAGVAIRTFEPGRDEAAVHAALAEGFAEHWGSAFPAFEEWRHREIEGEGSEFDPSLWFLATEGDEVVGAASCRARSPRADDIAVVGELAVRKRWRRRGIGLALLQTAFGAFHDRGIPGAELGVDSENATGATRLYESAGMRVAFSWEFWEKQMAEDDAG
jgi:mycothiol synthase